MKTARHQPGAWTVLGFVLLINIVGAAPAAVVSFETAVVPGDPWYLPPAWVFPVVWTVLFTLAGVAVAIVWTYDRSQQNVRVALGAFIVQFGFNLLWSPVFFGLDRPGIAFGILGGLLVTLLITIVAFRRVDQRSGLLLVPYFLWVCFAGVLNARVVVG